MNANILQQFKAARRCGVPVVAISSPDQYATVDALTKQLNGSAPVFKWDCLTGYSPLNKAAREAIGDLVGDDPLVFTSPVAAISNFQAKAKERWCLIMLNASRFFDDVGVIQSICNCRDALKANGRTIVLLGAVMRFPAEIAGDIVLFDEPLPNAEQLTAIVERCHSDAKRKLAPEISSRAVEAVQGLPAFQAEQACALSLVDHDPINLDELWQHKRTQIEQTPGLKVWRGGERFADVGGVERIKTFTADILKGNGRPNAIVFLDEIEKMMGGSDHDTSGTSQDQLGKLLSYMQDSNAAGMIFVGPPGAAKSAVAKAAGNEGGIPTIQLDLGALKGSLVGQSENQIRAALKVITAVSNGRSLWIATSNKLSMIKDELKRRFNLGIFYFDLPTARDREAIWTIHKAAYGLTADHSEVNADSWTGADIRACCDIAWRLGGSLKDAATYVVPVAKSSPDKIESLRTQAEGKYLSASYEGVYRRQHEDDAPALTGRQFHAD